MNLLAKSPEYGGLTLQQHTEHVVAAVTRMAEVLGFNEELARHGAILHDLGKAHPYFQSMIHGQIDKIRAMQLDPHRHELSSLLFLPLFDRGEWPALVDMVVAHHKSVVSDKKCRGLLDLVLELGNDRVFEWHAEKWEEWSQMVEPIVTSFGLPFRPISREECRGAFDFAVQYCDSKGRGWSQLRGLLMGADHFASAMAEQTAQALSQMYKVPDLSFYDRPGRRMDIFPLSMISTDDPRPHTFVVASTGAGKTDFLLRRCRGRVFYTLPFQASINAMFLRLDNQINRDEYGVIKGKEDRTDIRRVHAASRIKMDEDDPVEDIDLQRHPGASVKILTPYQIASIVFGIGGYEAMSLDLREQDVILDEVHVYNDVARAMVIEIVQTLVRLGCRVHIGTATIPTELANYLRKILGGERYVYDVMLPIEIQQTFNRHIIHKHSDDDSVRGVLAQAVSDGEHILLVSNRVAAAQRWFEWARSEFPNIPIMLIHSRFRRCDRANLERQISEYERFSGPCIVCSTQVLEVSLDISFDRMITDAAPLDSLVQRFGRVNRKRTREIIARRLSTDGSETYKHIHVLAPPETDRDIKPYDAEVVRRSFEQLPDERLLEESKLQGMIDAVYPSVPLMDISLHFLIRDGVFAVQELENRNKSVLIEALDIDSAACILESDYNGYMYPHGISRQELEIPVPWSVIARFRGRFKRLEMGNYPMVVPDQFYNAGGVQSGLCLPNTAEVAQPSFDQRYI